MKIVVPYLLIFLFLFTGNNSFAQNSIFAGKIIDENNKPIPGARIKVTKYNDIITETVADNDGLYYTQLLPWGYYNIDIIANDKLIRAKKVYLKAQDKIRWYYNLQVHDNKAEVIVTAHDPFMATKLGKIEEKQKLNDFGVGTMWIIKIDTATGKITGISGNNAPEAPPHVK